MAPQLRAFGHHLDELAPRITDVELAKGRAMEGGSLGLRVDDQVRLVTTRSSGWLVALAAGALVIVLVEAWRGGSALMDAARKGRLEIVLNFLAEPSDVILERIVNKFAE